MDNDNVSNIDHSCVDLTKLEYGAYIVENPIFTENTRYATAEFNKLHIRRVRLPDGRGNIIYLMTNSFENALKIINSKVFISPPTYRKFYYPWIIFDSFMSRRFKINVVQKRTERQAMIREHCKGIQVYPTRTLMKGRDNIFFNTSDIYEAVFPLIKKFPIKRGISEFHKEFNRIITKWTPEIDKPVDDKNFNNRIMIIDADAFAFKQGSKLEENKTNPLFLIYLAFLRTRNLTVLNIDQDMLICSKNMFLKFNPAKINQSMWGKFRMALFRIMKANLDNYVDQLSEEEQDEITQTSEDHIVHNIVNDAIDPYVKDVSPSTKGVLADAIDGSIRTQALSMDAVARIVRQEKNAISKNIGTDQTTQKQPSSEIPKRTLSGTNPYEPLAKKKENLFNAIIKDYRPLAQKIDGDDGISEEDEDVIEEYEDEIKSDVNDIMNTDETIKEEVIDEIQDKVAPLDNIRTAPINSARDKKLREKQKKVIVRTSTIEEILERDIRHVPIQSDNKGHALKTTNKNMHNVTFANFDKTYIDELYTKDILTCFDMLKDKNAPFYITGVTIKDTSDSLNLKETWSVHLTDETGERSTVKIDVPKFYQNRFMWLNGSKWVILKQNLYNPIVKDSPDVLFITTNYNKITIKRKATKSIDAVERIFSLEKTAQKRKAGGKIFIAGDSSKENINSKFINSLEYDELSRRIFKYSSDGCEIYFSREYLQEKEKELKPPKDIKGNEFFIGYEKDVPILINEDSGLDRLGRTISEIIVQHLPEDYRIIYNNIKSSKQPMFVRATMSDQPIPVVVILTIWIGFSKMLDKLGIKWTFRKDIRNIPKSKTSGYIKFANGVLEYEKQIHAELILNGINQLNPSKLNFEDLDSPNCCDDYIKSLWGDFRGIGEIRTFYEFLIDPITKDVCKDLMLPTEADELLIYAVRLLCDNKCATKSDDRSYRLRSIEQIPSVLYSLIVKQYSAHLNKGVPMTLQQNILISTIMNQKKSGLNKDEYSTLNPVVEVARLHTVSTKGVRGSNTEESYDEKKRSYSDTSVGKIAMSTSTDLKVGINKEIVIEPTLTNVRGYRDQVEDVETLKDVNLFSPVEMLTPGCVRHDDAIRTAMAGRQSGHVVPVEDASPALISNGFDESIQFHLSNDFVVNAEEDGEVIDVNNETGFIIVKYKSGKNFAINTSLEIVKNSGSAFFLANQLKPTLSKVGQKFKKDDVLAYHPRYFQYSKMNGLRYSMGPLVKMAIMSTYNTYEDAGICTNLLAERMKSKITYQTEITLKRNSNVLQMVKIGDKVNIGDLLLKYDTSHDDAPIVKWLERLSDEEDLRTLHETETKSDVRADNAGVVIDIKVYTTHDPSNLSASLGKIVKQYFKKGINRKTYLERYDDSPGIVKAGYMLTDNTEPTVSRFGKIKRHQNCDVLIEIYIESSHVMGVGDKLALYSANKQIVSEIIPEGYEPYSEFRPDEEISVLTSPGTIARRMTTSVIQVGAAMKVMIELKRKIQDMIRY